MKYIFTALAVIFAISTLLAQQNPMELNWQFAKLGSDLGKAGLLTEDLDGDGKSEIVLSGKHIDNSWEGSDFISILKYQAELQAYETIWTSRVFFSPISALSLYDINNDGIQEIYIGFENGEVHVYEAGSRTEVANFDVTKKESTVFEPNPINGIEFGDFDNDSSVDLVVLLNDSTFMYDSSYRLSDKIPYGAAHCKIGNIDGDPNQEVVYSNGQIIEMKEGVVLEEYEFFTQNKGAEIGLDDFNKDNILDVVYSSSDSLYAYDFKNKQRIWTAKWESEQYYDSDIEGLWLFDYDGDGVKDVFIGFKHYDGIYCYNGKDGRKEFSFYDFSNDGVVNASVADLDGDANLELIWSAGSMCTCADYLFVYDLSTKTREWKSKYFSGDFKAFDVGDVDHDGKPDIAVGLFGEYLHYYDYEFISIFDAATKALKMQNQDQIFGNHRVDDISSLKIGDVDNDGHNELLVGVAGSYSSSKVYIFDAEYNFERYFEIDGMDNIMDIGVADIDMDGKNEVIITSGTYVSGSTHPDEWQNYIYVFDGETGALEWKSRQLAGIGSKIGSLTIGNVDEDAALEIVAVLYPSWAEESGKLYVIDGKNYVLVEKAMDVTAIDLIDFDHDGIKNIVAGNEAGEVAILDGTSLEVMSAFETGANEIRALKAADLNNDHHVEFVMADAYKLYIYDTGLSAFKWYSDTLNSSVGTFNSLLVTDLDADQHVDILLNGGHALYNFEIHDYEALEVVLKKKTATVTITELNREYSGEPRPVTVVTEPAGLTVEVYYNGLADVPAEVGEYSVQAVVVDDHYEGEASALLSISAPTAVFDPVAEQAMLLYPNPTTGRASLKLQPGTKARLTLTDMYGRIIQQTAVINSDEIDLGSNASGLYFLRVEPEGKPAVTVRLFKK